MTIETALGILVMAASLTRAMVLVVSVVSGEWEVMVFSKRDQKGL